MMSASTPSVAVPDITVETCCVSAPRDVIRVAVVEDEDEMIITVHHVESK